MRVVMTGGGGFIGAHLLARLVGAGMDVTLIGSTTGKSRYTESLVRAGTVRFLRCSDTFADEDILRPALAGVDALVLLGYVLPAAMGPGQRLSEEFALNVSPLIRLLRATDTSPRHVVFASSVAVYGVPRAVPVRETDAPSPKTPYAIAKLAAEESIQLLCDAAGSSASILRYATVYGPGETVSRAVPNFIRAALAGQPPLVNGGADEHDYVHVCDVAEATLQALRRHAAGTYNIGTGVGTRTLDLCNLVLRLAGAATSPVFRMTDRSEKPVRVVCSTERASADLGFVARRQLSEGITEEIGWFRSEAEAEAVPTAALAIA
ncbi:MAG: NAD-dependent epimerase/dehydratase family protein [Chloroflexi bacterium]|nr:MAG: NAD-dependent epimerase/dehydratase family protein [Chloroflexota bacterium]